MAGRLWGSPGGTPKGNGSSVLLNVSQPAPGAGDGARPRPSWLAATLASILIFTIVVDIVGNLLVVLSVYRNKKLRNAGRGSQDPAGCTGKPPSFPDGNLSPVPPPLQARSCLGLSTGSFLEKLNFFS